ncbi:MAG TPA: hypothetical protein VIY29_25265 [Ktedonobacteraceae bacterium]
MTQNVWGRLFQLSCQILELLAACDISLQLRKKSQLLCSMLPYLLHCSLRDTLCDSWGGRMPLPGVVTLIPTKSLSRSCSLPMEGSSVGQRIDENVDLDAVCLH